MISCYVFALIFAVVIFIVVVCMTLQVINYFMLCFCPYFVVVIIVVFVCMILFCVKSLVSCLMIDYNTIVSTFIQE